MLEPVTDTCVCSQHTGPHWLYQDYQARRGNLIRLEWVISYAEAHLAREMAIHLTLYAQEETARLQTKAVNLHDGKAYPYSLLGPGIDDLDAIAKRLWGKLANVLNNTTWPVLHYMA